MAEHMTFDAKGVSNYIKCRNLATSKESNCTRDYLIKVIVSCGETLDEVYNIHKLRDMTNQELVWAFAELIGDEEVLLKLEEED